MKNMISYEKEGYWTEEYLGVPYSKFDKVADVHDENGNTYPDKYD